MKATNTQECVACATPLAFVEEEIGQVEYCDPCAEEISEWHAQQERDYGAAEAEADAFLAQYDDDPNPYHGTYSEE